MNKKTMNLDEVFQLNQFLQSVTGENQIEATYIDNLHTPFVKLATEYPLPAFAKSEIDYASARQYLSVLADFIPEAIHGCFVLPQAIPKRESDKLFLVRPCPLNGSQYLYILKLFVNYLGGADESSILQAENSYHSPSIRTDRIYFSVSIIPLDTIESEKDCIISFQPRFFSAVQNQVVVTEPENLMEKRPKAISLFDEIDYSTTIEPIKNRLRIRRENWQPATVHEPIVIEYRTISFRPIELSFHEIQNSLAGFYQGFEQLLVGKAEISDDYANAFLMYLNRNAATRAMSPSGNICWKFFLTN